MNRQFERGVLFVPDAVPEEAMPGLRGLERYAPPDNAVDEALGLEPERYDLAVSLLTLHQTNDTPGVLAQIRRALKPDGLFLACVPGGATLGELRESLLAAEVEMTGTAHARVLPFMDVRDAGALLQRAGFSLPVADTEKLAVRYDTMFDLMRDLRAMGATNTLSERSRRFVPSALFNEAALYYAQNHADPDGRIRATFDLVWMSGWAPHESQQKPLKPGSAANRLADFIGDKSGGRDDPA
jgi:SAM-dependent methyltransferase